MSQTDDASAPLILIDGSSWLYRAFHALPPLTAPDGEPTGAVYGMGNMLRRLQKDYAPERIAVIFDPRGKTFRNDIYAEYKANRPPTPEELASQFPLIKELLAAMGIPMLQIDGVEADDVIGTLATQARARDWQVLVVTGDKDMAQLVDEQVQLLDTMKNKRLDAAAVTEKFGVPPELIVDYLALMGDSSDNIPGINGVGPKTAAKWLNQYGDLDTLIAKADEVGGKIGEKLRAGLEQLPMAKDLATIRCEIEIPADLDTLVPGDVDTGTFVALCQRLGFSRWIEDSSSDAEAAPAGDQQAVATETTTVLSSEQLDELAEALQQAELICLDCETDALDSMAAGLVGLSFAVTPGKAWYLPISHDYMGAPDQLSLDQVRKALGPVLADADKPKLGQHIKYDLNVLARHDLPVAGVTYDSMLESYVLDPTASRHDMDTLAMRHLQHATIKFSDVAGKGKKQLTFNQIDLEQAAPYAGEDADITLRLHQQIYPQLQKVEPLEKLFREIEMPLVPVLAQVERNGVKVDAKLLGRISAELAERQGEIQQQAFEEAGGEFNLGSPAQLQEILFEKLGLRVVKKTPKGQPSTAEDVLQELADEHPLPRLILEWRGMAKLRSTYTESLPKQINPKTGRIHTSYHQAVAATGRLSSTEPNLQNIPIRTAAGKRIREAFIAEPDCSLVAIDYSQIELRLMAHLSEDTRLQEAFRSAKDVHRATAAEVFGVELDRVSEDQRRSAKAINFGLIYGMSAFGLAKQLGIARGDAQDYIDRFFQRYPGVQAYMEGTREFAREHGYVQTLRGRRLYLPDIKARNQNLRQYAERTAINAPLQGTAADLIKLAMLDIHEFLQDNDADVRMIMQVHDELVFEGPTEQIQALAPKLAERMCKIVGLSVPLVADWGIGTQWNQAHTATDSVSS